MADVYVTNAVKHFRFTERGKRRIHATPQVTHIKACRPWLEAEVADVDPQLVVALGATAAKSHAGPGLPDHRSSAATVLELPPPFGAPPGAGHDPPLGRAADPGRTRARRGLRRPGRRPPHRGRGRRRLTGGSRPGAAAGPAWRAVQKLTRQANLVVPPSSGGGEPG